MPKITVLAFLALSIFAVPAYAEDACSITGNNDPLICGTPSSNEEEALQLKVKNVLEVVYLWIGIIAVIFIVVGGIRYMTSAGEASKAESAKKTITYSVIGLVVVLAAFAITEFFIGALEGRAPDEKVAVDPGGGGDGTTPVKMVILVGSVTLKKGNEYKFRANIVPDYATDRSVTWASSKPEIATISKDGQVKAIKDGKTTITVTASNGIKSSKTVTVLKEIEPTSVKIVNAPSSIELGSTVTLKATVLPRNAEDKSLTWTSSNEDVLTVSGNGVIKASKTKKGKAKITAKTKNDKKHSVTIEVVEKGGNIAEDFKLVNLKGKPEMRKETWKIINDHRMDFYQNSYDSYISKHGGYNKYVKNLGGVFAKYATTDKIPIKTAADFQEAAEYVWGLMTIWGGDYYGNHNNAWRNNKAWKNGKSDRYRSSFGGNKYGNRTTPINPRLKSKKDTNYVCSTMLGTFISSTNLKFHYIEDDPGPRQNMVNKFGSFRDATKLQVGDVLYWLGYSHVAIVGEVYKDKVVIYDGGSKFTKAGKYKFTMNRKKNQSDALRGSDYSGAWIAVRPWKIDQSKVLKGINN